MDTLWQDIRYGCRMLGKNPGFTAVAALTLALGIGANAAIFSVVNSLVFLRLPYPDADRVIEIRESNASRGWERVGPSFPNYQDWRAQNQTFEEIAAYQGAGFNLTGGSDPVRVTALRATARLFDVLKRQPAMGRGFRPEEDRPGAARVAVISDGLWKRSFGSDAQILGKVILLDAVPHTVVGVMPADFFFPVGFFDLWVPLQVDHARGTRGLSGFGVVGRLKKGASLEQARADLGNIASRLEKEYPETNQGWGVYLASERDFPLSDRARLILTTMYLGVVFVLLIACANVANLLLARAATREREIAVRMALGGRRVRIIRQLLTESVLLALLGGIGGVVVAHWGLRALLTIAPADDPFVGRIRMDSTALVYLLGVCVVTGVIFGLAPALQVTRTNLQEALKEGGRAGRGRSRHALLKSLVVSEVALALVLLVCGGLMVRSFVELLRVRPGFDTKNVLTLRVTLPEASYEDPAQRIRFFEGVLTRLRALPGVEGAAATHSLPMGGADWAGIEIGGRPLDPGSEPIGVGLVVVTPDYFRVMGIPLLLGHAFAEQDAEGAPRVVMVNETMARRYWPEEANPIGKHILFAGDAGRRPWTIVGVAGDVRHERVRNLPRPEIFVPHAQFPEPSMTFVLRTAVEPLSLARAAREVVQATDTNLAVYSLWTMEQVVANRTAGPRAGAHVMGTLALLALVLSTVGIYGVVGYSVAERRHEIGIRMALGAQPDQIFRLVLGQGMMLVGLGLAIGLAGSLAAMRLLASLLYSVTPDDPFTYGAITVFLLGVAVLASYLPARRAMRVNPIVALRYE